ncbi:Midasin [Paramyrothecium foliicola]|nr:Midasin [Paramyrothecium foliicola]
MAVVDVSRQRRSLLQDATVLDHLPAELLDVVKDHATTRLLDAVSEAALIPPLTERIFVHFEDVFPDVCARWTLNTGDERRRIRIISAFSRILPFAPHLATFLDHHVAEPTSRTDHPSALKLTLTRLDDAYTLEEQDALLERLVAYWRLLNFQPRQFGSLVSPAVAQSLFQHEDRAIRYMAVRIFCQTLHASDQKLETLLEECIGRDGATTALLDGVNADYTFLTLYEHTRAKKLLGLREKLRDEIENVQKEAFLHSLTPYVVPYGNVILPRPLGAPSDSSDLVMTATTTANLENLASMLREADPVLLYGPSGVGKTAMVHEVAKQLGMYSNMVTLHLNEQTDAKMLIGLYSTDVKPGSFQWRPGVLTTAVREGRWVLVEDLDRAPTEVISTLLPLIERKELLIPSRGERIRAADSFRLFATVRTSRGMNGRENLPSLVGMRFWQCLYTQPLIQTELEEVISEQYPVLQKYIPAILAVFGRMTQLSKSTALMSRGKSIMDRQLSLMDLLKWCRRLRECLKAAGSTTGDEPISETTRDWMFMEAIDCFIGSCPDADLSKQLVFAIAEEMHIPKERAEHYISANVPPLQENDKYFTIGRAQLPKKKMSSLVQKSKRPFASTAHAKRLLEQIAMSVKLNEPVLLVGETGIGKTTVVQQLADSLGHKLIAVNLSQQSEVGDLLGGFKPVNVRSLAVPLKEEFEDLFSATGISASKNQKYLEQVGKCFAKGQWSRVSKLWREAPKMFQKIIKELEKLDAEQSAARNGDVQPTKRRKTQSKLQTLLDLRPRWDLFARNLEQFDVQISGGSGSFAFSFVEGNIIKAVRNGDWVLLDEINLASPDTLESIADLLTGPSERPSILLSETGEIEKIVAHPNFRIFGAMNPATDIGKRDLPVGIRSRFTELYVRSPDADLKDLLTIIKTYLGSGSHKNDQAADDIARLYLNTKRMAEEKRLVDGANEVPHFSLRTLTRVLSYVNTIAPYYGIRRALYEGFSMGFLTLLDRDSEKLLVPLIHHHLLDRHGDPQSLLSQNPKHPNDGKQYVRFKNKNRDRQYWLFQGEEPPVERDDYIITPYVERNLLNLVRATSTRRFPILIQGPTSAGKTSMIEYLANFTGNKFVRINNHEHTDLQEYLGTYVSGPDGKLHFQEGVLVQAIRRGYWIVLDELNLAPTDVLEALNRLLDDNRELLIPETQEVVKPHENFILFATQNPPGLYGGRKVLSRAFRNRFLELHFDDIPEDELEFILQQRSRNTSPPDCRRIVTVYKELSRLRQTSRVFEQKDSFATLRDLFRWALREADTREEIAAHGFMLLAERVRNDEERTAVKEVIEKVFKVSIDTQQLYSATIAPELKAFSQQANSQGVVWTHAMRRLYVLVSRALKNNEPVLLVGETGCGKTTVCQLLAEATGKELHIVNAHQNTETGDLIGSQRPVRNRGAILDTLNSELGSALESLGVDSSGTIEDRAEKYKSLDIGIKQALPVSIQDTIASLETRSKALFEWSDGALVEAMRNGDLFLLDEISLADDSVLERLNSVLEPQRTLLLAEKGVTDSFVVGAQGFQFFATMNPGGDFGKKELSPALRNRFTEIWVPSLSESEDIFDIVQTKLVESSKQLVDVVIQFATWFGETFRATASTRFSVREILGWVQFINTFNTNDPAMALVHGASTVFIDSIGANPSAIFATDPKSINELRETCWKKLGQLLKQDLSAIYQTQPSLSLTENVLEVGGFSVARASQDSYDPGFAFHAPTTRLNAMRVVRAMQMQKPILLEGSPGVGKTTLITALAQACGQPLTRINLSDQTDLMDLFGTDVPVEGAEAGNFAWRDAPFLQAMQKGEWVLLDEMNLASQSVLEGLNACLDHRGEVYVSELDQVFKRHPKFRLFAAQNPHHQGGGRKGLPSSFVNRFVVVYADVFTDDDLKLIAAHNFPDLPADIIANLIHFISQLEHQIVVEKAYGSQGGPWEFNLRDVLRWLNLLSSSDPLLQSGRVDDFLDMVVRLRFRTEHDRAAVSTLFGNVFGRAPLTHHLYHVINSAYGEVGLALLTRDANSQPQPLPPISVTPRLSELESLMICVKQNMPCIISGPSGFGKSALLEYVAALAGKPLVIFPLNADIDTMDLVGGFEQADPLREINAALRDLNDKLRESIMSVIPAQAPSGALNLLHLLDDFSGDTDELHEVRRAIEALLSNVASDSEVGVRLSSTLQLLHGPLYLANPRFEWLDGVLVKALQTGQWLVLDNANMCNASVLDRLNSLLEPNGFLSINEHCGPGGEPRIIKPHPEFRIFLTMDPRYGELSRAMRNRAIEIHIHTAPPSTNPCFRRIGQVESNLQRYMMSADFAEVASSLQLPTDALHVALDNFSIQDISLLPQFVDVTSKVLEFPVDYSRTLQDLLKFLQSTQGSTVIQSVLGLYAKLPLSSNLGLRDTQPIHPLSNFSLSQQLSDVNEANWDAARYEIQYRLYQIYGRVEAQSRQAHASKLSSLNRLQRSLISDRVAAVSKDSTVKLSTFLTSVYAAIQEFLMLQFESLGLWKDRVKSLRFLLQYLERTISLSTDSSFDEAKFQAHLAQGTMLLQKRFETTACSEDQRFIHHCIEQITKDFSQGFRLTTGLSMEILWGALRPSPIPDQIVLQRSQELEKLGQRFDALRWKARSSVSDLSTAFKTLEQAYYITRSSAQTSDGLVKDLVSVIETLETNIGIEVSELQPFFTEEFERLRQIAMLRSTETKQQGGEVDHELMIMSNTPIQAGLILASSSGSASLLQSIDYLTYQGRFTWDGRLIPSLWSKLETMASVNLNSLALLEKELPLIGRHMMNTSEDITADPLTRLNCMLMRLHQTIFAAHAQDTEDVASLIYKRTLEHKNDCLPLAQAGLPVHGGVFKDILQSFNARHFQQVAAEHMIPSIIALAGATCAEPHDIYLSALAWIHFSAGAVKLYVPDRAYDPQLRPRMEREFFETLQQQLKNEISALKAFEASFTGQQTNVRIAHAESDLEELGPLPKEIQPVYRPELSELSQLQAEFSNILKVAKGSSLTSVLLRLQSNDTEAAQEVHFIRENTERLLQRLTTRFEAYQDMTRPAVNLLRCLLVGLSLCDAVQAAEISASSQDLLQVTPFFGGSAWDARNLASSATGFELLSLMNVAVSVETLEKVPANIREGIAQSFHRFYEEWEKKLEADRKSEEAKASLYQFRGSAEDEEEVDAAEFNDLFPSYDEDGEPVPSKDRDVVRNTSLKVASTHRRLFLEKQEPVKAIKELCFATGQQLIRETKEGSYIDRCLNGKMLAGSMLLLDDQVNSLNTSTVDSSYNFYNDANLPEVRQLVVLSDKIKARFRELQLVDELGHMQPLADVIQSCDKLLELVHTEPLAKILPKVEQLHGHVYEWEFGGWASRIYSVLPLHNSLTDTVIRWRRLELSTWANLFDMEMKKCEDTAYSWWFVAYQVVVAVPLTMVDSEADLRDYAIALNQNLEMYFSTSIAGQFKTRLALLTQLKGHLDLLFKDYPSLDIISNAVANFINYYRRYEKPAGDAIQKGRLPLEKKMKDVLLMASWKDTNINALRESARKSHQKLFRIIRKFRGILGQEMKAIIEQGLPDENVLQAPSEINPLLPPEITQAALGTLQQHIPEWVEKHRRMANVPKTISVMARISASPELNSSVPNSLDELVESLNTSMAELRTETPAFLTDENKDIIKHLKTRKRKLFAETLRDLRHMGLKYNLGQDKLALQESLAVVLASTRPINLPDSRDVAGAEYYLHKVLDLIPRVRLAANEHSEDLTGAEVARSIGFVEGMLQFLLNQRNDLAGASVSLSSLSKSTNEFQELGDIQKHGIIMNTTRSTGCTKTLPWLTQILAFATRLVEIHEKLGQSKHEDIVQLLHSWSSRLDNIAARFHDLGLLPGCLHSEARSRLETELEVELTAFRTKLEQSLTERPMLGFILGQVIPWTYVSKEPADTILGNTDIERLSETVAALCNKVLVAIEKGRKAGANVPRDEEQPGWLSKHNASYFNVVKQLHIENVDRSIRQCIQDVQQLNLEQPHVAEIAMSLFGLAAPIVSQYTALCQRTIEQGLAIHRASGHLAFNLTKTFTQIASQGFCTPKEKSDETSGDAGKVESGTGLGDGEGAEDISKDIQPDEDLSELAQEPNKDDKGDIEDEKDAVDMADEELEGDMGSVDGAEDDEEGSKNGDEEEEKDDMDEEAGDVDDLDPTAVDEKMWDGKDEEEAEKDQEGDKAKGQQKSDEQMANEGDSKQEEAEEEQKKEDAGEEDGENPEAEPENVQPQEELNKQEQTAQENDTLALPEEMELDFDEQESAVSDSDDLDMASDAEAQEEETEPQEVKGEEDENGDEDEEKGAEQPTDADVPPEEDEVDEEAKEAPGTKDEVQDEVRSDVDEEEEQEQPQEEQTDQTQPPNEDVATADNEHAAPSDVKSSGQDQNADAMDLDDQFQSKAAQQEDGEMGEAAADQDTSAGNKGATSRSAEQINNQDLEQDSKEESQRSNPFKKLGDALERWHRQQSDIHDANPENDSQENAQDKADNDQAQREFQHLQDDEAAPDAQAMGTADNEDVQPIDDAMAIDEEHKDTSNKVMETDKDENNEGESGKMDEEEEAMAQNAKTEDQDDTRSGVKTRQGNFRDESPSDNLDVQKQDEDGEDQIEETSTQLSTTHISDAQRPLRDMADAMQQWSEFQSKTHALSLSLTSQLRLILTPSQSTKLSGSFRTGKRLNIKRIIPYIASSYKRDKIWMRRAIPTKRTYQILLCVDDSKSMGESSSGNLAMESLVMVSRSLTMLEAGQVGVAGFGSEVFTAHQLTEPFAADAGGKVLQQFTFSQDSTDIARLIRQTIDTFRVARQQSSGNSDLWQLALILSDGLTPSSAHDDIRRLLREAMEERIMIVFIIMDDTGKKKGDSVLELKEAKFINEGGESRVVIERYLDTFPFQYYLIVHHLEELPSALAGLLRTWFAEDSSNSTILTNTQPTGTAAVVIPAVDAELGASETAIPSYLEPSHNGRRCVRDALHVCDMQERFANAIYEFDRVATTIEKVLHFAKAQSISVHATTQTKAKLGPTVPSLAALLPSPEHDKTRFSMYIPSIISALGPEPAQIALVGIESHICITQTALDLRDAGHRVYILADGVSSCNRTEVVVALDRLRAEQGITVTSSESWMYECLGDASHPGFKGLIGVVKGTASDTKNVLEALPPVAKM